MVKSMYSNNEFMMMLSLHDFDFENYVPAFVVFWEKKNNGYTNRNKKYFYKIHKDMLNNREDMWVVCPVYEENRFQVGKIIHMGEHICYETVPEIAEMIEGSYPFDHIKNCRSVVARVNNDDIDNYYKSKLQTKVRNKLEKELETIIGPEDVIFFYQTGAFRPQVQELIEKISKIDKGEL